MKGFELKSDSIRGYLEECACVYKRELKGRGAGSRESLCQLVIQAWPGWDVGSGE